MASQSHYFIFWFLVVLTIYGSFSSSSAQLSPNYYAKTCPIALSIIRSVVYRAVYNESRMGASLLRLHFHDCFVNGCDASILLDDDERTNITSEKSAGPNANSVRGFEVIDNVKTHLEKFCPGVVSCADIIAVAARDSVTALGGPTWTVQLGRRDSTTASFSNANTDLASPLMNLDELIAVFAKKGLSAKEMVALSGAHSIGQSRCLLFRNRIHNETNIDSEFAKSAQSYCPNSGKAENLSPLDVTTPAIFDNAYFRNLIENKGLLHSDQQLFNGGSTDSLVTEYSNNAYTFNNDFADAMAKMGNISTLTGSDGEIRTNCRKLN